MNILGEPLLGILILSLLIMQSIIMRISTKSFFHLNVKGDRLVVCGNFLNMFILFIVNPAISVLLLLGFMEKVDITRFVVTNNNVKLIIEGTGLILYFGGHVLASWGLIILGHNYQLGGQKPRENDDLVKKGPYAFIRHPLYTAVLCLALGLSLLVQSVFVLFLFIFLLIMILVLLPVEELQLLEVYGGQYSEYQKKVKKLIPFLY